MVFLFQAEAIFDLSLGNDLVSTYPVVPGRPVRSPGKKYDLEPSQGNTRIGRG